MRRTPVSRRGRGGTVTLLLMTAVASAIVGHASSSFPKRIPIGNFNILLWLRKWWYRCRLLLRSDWLAFRLFNTLESAVTVWTIDTTILRSNFVPLSRPLPDTGTKFDWRKELTTCRKLTVSPVNFQHVVSAPTCSSSWLTFVVNTRWAIKRAAHETPELSPKITCHVFMAHRAEQRPQRCSGVDPSGNLWLWLGLWFILGLGSWLRLALVLVLVLE